MSLLIVLTTLVASTIAESYEDREYYRYRGPPAPLSSDGMVMDTPEVARARAAHFAMHAETIARLRKARKDYDMQESNVMSYMPQPMGPLETVMQKRQRALEQWNRNGRAMEAPGMTEVINPRLSARPSSKELYEFGVFDGRRNYVYLTPVRVPYKHGPGIGYGGPMAPLGPDGRVVDTPEVMRAREAHMKAHARAMTRSPRNNVYY